LVLVAVDLSFDWMLVGSYSLNEKLVELSEAQTKKPDGMHGCHLTSNLLSELVKRDSLNTLILNLYPQNQGYSLMLTGYKNAESERLSYEVFNCSLFGRPH
jgi:hypothetical protein